jgi:hypothetical protein
MATKLIKKIKGSADSDLPAGVSEIAGLKSSRYEKLQVSYGVIKAADYDLGDTVVFADVPSKDIVKAELVAHAAQPITLEVYPGTDVTEALDLAVLTEVDISYIIEYVRGTGRTVVAEDENGDPVFNGEGDLLKITLGAS